MTADELIEKLEMIQKMKSETNTLELKSAEKGCPQHLYDSLSSFSNQDEGGIIIFGIDEKQDYKEVGVYDPQDIQKKINEQCLQMEPIVRPLLTIVEKDGKSFVAAEIPGVDLADRPVFYKGKGRLKGSYTRVGDSDEPMTEYAAFASVLLIGLLIQDTNAYVTHNPNTATAHGHCSSVIFMSAFFTASFTRLVPSFLIILFIRDSFLSNSLSNSIYYLFSVLVYSNPHCKRGNRRNNNG